MVDGFGMSDLSNTSRRRFLISTSAAAMAAGGAAALPACGNSMMNGDAGAATVGSVPIGTFVTGMSGSKPYILGHDAAGFYAYSSTCTHQGCIVPAPSAAGATSMCPCHLSNYDDNGHLLQPAPGSINQA